MTKKVFISYSWGTEEHQEWVLTLAQRLMNNGVDIVLDRWDLKEGHDVYDFMESMVKSEEISKVLIICDNNYQRKADKRDGGVGTETQIITPEIYNKEKQEKFIPIVKERDVNGNPALPIYLSSRKYIDLSDIDYFEENYELLLRNILEAPTLKKPKLGQIPTYITDSIADNQTNFQVRSIDYHLRKNSNSVNGLTKEFIDTFLDNLWNYEFEPKSNKIEEFGDALFYNLRSYREIREDYISFISKVTKPEYNLDIDIIIVFFEKKNLYKKPRNQDIHRSTGSNFDNYPIIFQELFIYTVAICLKNLNYKLIDELLNSGYYFAETYRGDNNSQKFTEIYSYHQNWESYYQQKYKKITGFGDYVITNISPQINKDDYILADTLCYYISELNSREYSDRWFPSTYIYNNEKNFDFFKRMTSKRHFDKVKIVFNVKDEEELKLKLNKYKETIEREKRQRVSFGHFNYIKFLHEIIDIDKIGSER